MNCQWYNSCVLLHTTCCIVNPCMTRDLRVVKLAYAPLNNVFSSFVVFLLFEGCLVGILGSFAGAWLMSSILVVLYLCGNPFYSIRIFSLLMPPPPSLGMFFGLCFWSASVSDICLNLEAYWSLFPSSFDGSLHRAKIVDLSLMQAFLTSRVYTDFRAF